MPFHSISAVEILEARIVPAGIVTVGYTPATGELTLTGDTLNNEITLVQFAPNQYRFVGASNTILNPGGIEFMDIGKLTKLTFVGGNGNDTLFVGQVKTLTALTFDGGDGSDILSCVDVAVKGGVTFSGGGGGDNLNFSGLSAMVTGNVVVTDTTENVHLNFAAQKNVVGGSITINGGTGANRLENLRGSFSIGKGLQLDAGAGTAEIILDGELGTTIGKLPTGQSILFNGGAGVDVLQLSEGAKTLAGGIQMVGGADDDRLVFLDRTSPVKIGKLSTGQSVLFDGGAGSDAVTIAGKSVLAAGGLEILAGDGTNVFNLGSGSGRITVGKLLSGQSVKYTGGVSGDAFTINASSLVLAGSLDFSGSDGANTLTLANANGIAKIGKGPNGVSIRFVGGVQSNTFAAESANLALAGGFDFTSAGTNSVASFDGGNGRLTIGKMNSGHSIKFSGATGVSDFSTNVDSVVALGGVEFSAGNGANSLAFSGLEGSVIIGKLSTGESIRYVGAPGTDSIEISPSAVTLAGGVDFAGSDGTNSVLFNFSGARTRIVKIGALPSGQSVNYTGGVGEDTMTFGGRLATTGSLEMAGGNGDNELDVDSMAASIGKSLAGVSVRLLGGTGADVVTLSEALTIAGDIFLDGGAGDDALQFPGSYSVKVGGAVTLEGGSGRNQLILNPVFLAINKSLTINGADGGELISISADGVVGGGVNINLGTSSANSQNVTISSKTFRPSALLFKQGFNVVSATTAAAADALTLLNATVNGPVNISMGEGVTTVTIDNLIARGDLTITTNGGDDTVSIERQILPGNSIITKLASIQTGSGTDTVLIGGPLLPPNGGVGDSTRVRFLAGLTVDGGTGSDTANAIATENDFPAGAPTVTSFEVSAP
jgi:hypothetical protein